MCGFIVTQNKHMAVTMLQRQEFRGPDGMDFWSDNTLTLGHALLDISGQIKNNHIRLKKDIYLYLMEKCMTRHNPMIQSF